MKLLFDENLSPRLAGLLLQVFPGSQHVEQVGLRGATDHAIWDYAKANRFTIVSKDNDFRQLVFMNGPPPKVIWLSIGNAGTSVVAALLREQAETIQTFHENPEEGLLVLESGPSGKR